MRSCVRSFVRVCVCACMNVCIYVCMHECMKNVHDIFFNISRTSLFCSYHCVHNLFTQFAYLMRFRSSTTVLITYVVLFCFLLFEPVFNRSNFTFMLLTHPRRSRDPHVHMYVTFILKMAIPAFQSKATLLTAWSKQRVCFSQPSNCLQCLEIKLFLSTNWF